MSHVLLGKRDKPKHEFLGAIDNQAKPHYMTGRFPGTSSPSCCCCWSQLMMRAAGMCDVVGLEKAGDRTPHTHNVDAVQRTIGTSRQIFALS